MSNQFISQEFQLRNFFSCSLEEAKKAKKSLKKTKGKNNKCNTFRGILFCDIYHQVEKGLKTTTFSYNTFTLFSIVEPARYIQIMAV